MKEVFHEKYSDYLKHEIALQEWNIKQYKKKLKFYQDELEKAAETLGAARMELREAILEEENHAYRKVKIQFDNNCY
jgi:hypothetical protein